MDRPEQGFDAPMDMWFDSNDVGFDMNDEHQCLYRGHRGDTTRPLVEGEWIVAGMEDLRIEARVEKIRGDWVTLYFPYADRRINP